jgi:hypothetical protein
MRNFTFITTFLILFFSHSANSQTSSGLSFGASGLIVPKGFQNPYYINGMIRPSCGVFWRKQLTEKSQLQIGLHARMTSFKRYIYNSPQYTYRDPIIYREYSLFVGIPVEAITSITPRFAISYGFETLFNVYSMQRGQRYELRNFMQPRLVNFHEKSPNESLISISPTLGVVLPMTDNWEAFIKCGYSLNNYFKTVTDEDNMHFFFLTIGASRHWSKGRGYRV